MEPTLGVGPFTRHEVIVPSSGTVTTPPVGGVRLATTRLQLESTPQPTGFAVNPVRSGGPTVTSWFPHAVPALAANAMVRAATNRVPRTSDNGTHAEPARRRDQPLPPPTQGQPGR